MKLSSSSLLQTSFSSLSNTKPASSSISPPSKRKGNWSSPPDLVISGFWSSPLERDIPKEREIESTSNHRSQTTAVPHRRHRPIRRPLQSRAQGPYPPPTSVEGQHATSNFGRFTLDPPHFDLRHRSFTMAHLLHQELRRSPLRQAQPSTSTNCTRTTRRRLILSLFFVFF